MDKNIIAQHFALAERHVEEGEQHIARQRELLARFERSGHPTKLAKEFLAVLEEIQKAHVADRDRLLKKLTDSAD